MLKIYGYYPSGNSYKLELLCSHLHLPYEFIDVDVMKGQSRTPEFLAMNPNGRVPVAEIAPGRYLSESNAIMFYLGERSELMPTDRWERGLVLQWMNFEQYHLEPHIGTARLHLQILRKRPEQCPLDLAGRQNEARRAIGLVDNHLSETDYLVGNSFSLADICLYAYIHVAHEGHINMEPFTHVNAWLNRVYHLPNHREMTRPDLND